MKRPVIDLSECVLCEICTDVCPSVFRLNDSGYVEVIEISKYPEEEVDDVIRNCRGDCITWEK